MNRIWIVAMVIGLCISTRAAGADEGRLELEMLYGTWEFAGLEVAGTRHPVAALKDFSVTINLQGLSYRFPVNGKMVHVDFTISIDPTAVPKAIDATILKGGHQGRVCRGIYQLDGDKLKIALVDSASPSQERPAEFRSTPDLKLHIFDLRRRKPEE